MAIVRNAEPTTEYEKEIHKWNTPKRLGGYGPDGHEAFPKMLYKAQIHSNGQALFMDLNAIYGDDMSKVSKAEAFNRSCQLTVKSQDEYDRALKNGWRDTPDLAMAYHEGLAQDVAKAAAEAAYSVQRMSDKAREEFRAADAETEHPVTDVVPVKRGRPKSVPS